MQIATTIAASGRLMTKTYRHEYDPASHPPSTGPSADVTADDADHRPIALPRDAPEKFSLMSARLSGTKSAAPMPWRQRAPIAISIVGAAAQSAEATAKITMPMTNVR